MAELTPRQKAAQRAEETAIKARAIIGLMTDWAEELEHARHDGRLSVLLAEQSVVEAIQRRWPDPEQALEWLRQEIAALEECHERAARAWSAR
jgi:hypothetical protein